MSDTDEPRLFESDAAVRHIGEGLIACSLDKSEWTHEAHLAACLWLIVERPDIVPERGHLWGRREIVVPAGSVERIEDDAVTLTLTKDEVGALAARRIHRWF